MAGTEHYGLKKPGQNDFYNVGDFNANADLIDAALHALDAEDKRTDNPHAVTAAQAGAWSTEVMRRVNWKPPFDASKYIYVSPSGSDTTGDGTQSKPFAKLSKAIDVGALYTRDSRVFISLAAGDYYEPELPIFGFSYIEINGPASGSRAKLHITGPVPSNSFPAYIHGNNFAFVHVDIFCDIVLTSDIFINVIESKFAFVNCNITNSATQTITTTTAIQIYRSEGYLGPSTAKITGFHRAIYALFGSAIYSSVSGEAFTRSYVADGSEIFVASNADTILAPAILESGGGRVTLSHLNSGGNATIFISTTGDDRNWGQSANHAIKTFARAAQIIHRYKGTGSITINAAAGSYDLPDTAFLANISSQIIMQGGGQSTTTLKVTHAGIGINVTHCQSLVIRDLTLTRTVQGTAELLYISNSYIYLYSAIITADASQSNAASRGIKVASARGVIYSCTISGMYVAINSVNGAIIEAHNMTGSGNVIGYMAQSGIIIITSARLSATTPERRLAGGIISSDTIIPEWTNCTLLNGATQYSPPLRYTKINGIVYLKGAVVPNTLSAIILCNLPAGFRPDSSAYFNAFIVGMPSRHSWIDPDGNVNLAGAAAPWMAASIAAIDTSFVAQI